MESPSQRPCLSLVLLPDLPQRTREKGGDVDGNQPTRQPMRRQKWPGGIRKEMMTGTAGMTSPSPGGSEGRAKFLKLKSSFNLEEAVSFNAACNQAEFSNGALSDVLQQQEGVTMVDSRTEIKVIILKKHVVVKKEFRS